MGRDYQTHVVREDVPLLSPADAEGFPVTMLDYRILRAIRATSGSGSASFGAIGGQLESSGVSRPPDILLRAIARLQDGNMVMPDMPGHSFSLTPRGLAIIDFYAGYFDWMRRNVDAFRRQV